MNEAELRAKLDIVEKEVLHHRYCMTADLEGAIKIIKENEDICVLTVRPKPYPLRGCDEYFKTIIGDDELKREAREFLLNNLCSGK